jgi:hypothetical protein
MSKERHRRKKLGDKDYAGYGTYREFKNTDASARIVIPKDEAMKIIASMADVVAQGYDVSLTLLKKNKHVMVYTRSPE